MNTTDYPARDELPTLLFEVRDAVARQVRCREAVYTGLGRQDAGLYHNKARAVRLCALRASILARVARLRKQQVITSTGPWPEHTCEYWRTRDGICSMCGVVLPC